MNELLAKRIYDSGLRKEYIASKIGITRQSLSKKINGDSDFTASEISKLKLILNLSAEDLQSLFFDNKCA